MPNNAERKIVLSEAKAMLTKLFAIRMVEKKDWGLFVKYKAFFAAILFFLALISILILLAET